MIELYKLLEINISLLIKNNYNLQLSEQQEKEYLIQQQGNALFSQIERIRGYKTDIISEIIFVQAKNKSKNEELIHILREGFYYNNTKYVRFGKSASQAKNGITVFISVDYFDTITESSQLGIKPQKCVISKYEAYRNLILSACEMVDLPMPYIIIIDDYEKIIPKQYVRYVTTSPAEFINKDGKAIEYKKKMINEGEQDIKISPFDGMGIHKKRVSQLWAESIKLKHIPISFQIRLPLMKGMSTEAPIDEQMRDLGIEEITDIFGVKHKVSDIDCIWTKSMWKGYSIFKKEFGNNAWNEYLQRIENYGYKLGISKYNHKVSNMNLYSRMNFQYLQCHDFLNNKYVDWFSSKDKNKYDFSIEDNKGKIIKIAEYSTDLISKIIHGDKLYTLKFLGIMSDIKDVNSKYIKATLINDIMLKDICVKKTLLRMLKKTVNQMKYGKIYTEGFYHIAVGDIIGLLEYCAGKEVKGCIDAREVYCKSLPEGDCVSMRSPLVDPSEVNKVKIVSNEITEKYLSYFEDNDVVMFSMYDISLPQQGGMDVDGDLVNLSKSKTMLDSVIEYPIIVDMTDKETSKEKEYNLDNIIEYECNTRDSRIGEITNIATSILNTVTNNEKYKQINKDNVAILRINQGKEIDFIKTGMRWNISKSLRQRYKRIPYFLLFNYPKKLKVYNKIKGINKDIYEKDDKIPYNAYKSASPMNELCDYINQWEKDSLIWDNKAIDTSPYLTNKKIPTDNEHIEKNLTKIYRDFTHEFYSIIDSEDKNNKSEHELVNSDGEVEKEDIDSKLDMLFDKYRKIIGKINLDKNIIANYLVKICYKFKNRDKIFCWAMSGDIILKNLKENSPSKNPQRIVETNSEDIEGKEYLGRYYKLVDDIGEECD